jgi:hypothetical protein
MLLPGDRHEKVIVASIVRQTFVQRRVVPASLAA